MKKLGFITLVVLVATGSLAQEQRNTFSKQEVLSDLHYLYTSLIDIHYDVYAYTSKDEYDSAYQAIKKSVTNDSLTALEAATKFQRLTAIIRNGHTGITFPISQYINYAYAGGTLFPLEIAFENNKALIRRNWSANEEISTGSEILKINGSPIKEILKKIYTIVPAERLYFKNAKIEHLTFPRYYWQLFGEQDEFDIEISNNGSIEKYTLKAIKALNDYEMKRPDILVNQRSLKFFDQNAYLIPGQLSGDEEKYQNFIDSAFVEIKKNNSQNLIIDLRNNGGGDNSFSDYFVSYIADKPFKWYSEFTLKTSQILKDFVRQNYDTTAAFWQSVLTHKNGETYAYNFDSYDPQPEEKRFHGKVYVLVNRQSYSQSSVTAAQVQDYGFATIVGEETGEYPTLYASIFQFQLPKTKMTVPVSKGRIVRVNGSTKEEGVIPDIVIKDHLLDEKDEVLDGLLEHLKK